MEVKDVELSLGVASFFVDHPGVMTAIQCVGVLFIGYLAVGALRDAWRSFRGNGTEALHPAQAKGWALVRRGVAMSMSNPLTILFFLAFLPNFTRDGATLAPAVMTGAMAISRRLLASSASVIIRNVFVANQEVGFYANEKSQSKICCKDAEGREALGWSARWIVVYTRCC